MRLFPALAILAFSAVLLPAQERPAAAEGIPPQWDARAMLATLADQAKQLPPILAKVHPQEWVQKGASDTYVTQWQHATTEVQSLVDSSTILAGQPERLTAAIDSLYRLENLDTLLASIESGIRRYQDGQLANQLQDVAAQNANNRERLRQYVLDLARQKETEFDIADKEAQRCRGELFQLQNPPARRPHVTKGK